MNKNNRLVLYICGLISIGFALSGINRGSITQLLFAIWIAILSVLGLLLIKFKIDI